MPVSTPNLRDAVRCLARAAWLAPLYFGLLTVFAVWPWRNGSPWLLLRSLRLPDVAWRASVLRLVAFRLFFREKRLARPQGRRLLAMGRFYKWLRSPWTLTIPSCARATRAEMTRTGQTGVLTAVAVFSDALVDSYRYAVGRVDREWFDLERRAGGAFHIPNDLHIRCCCHLLNHALNPRMPPSQSHFDKAEFHRLCQAHDLPSVPNLAVFEDGLVKEQRHVGDEALFSKPADLTEGKGNFARWDPLARRTAGEQVYQSNDGRELTLAGIFEVLRVQSREGPYLLQPSLSNHEAIRRFAGLDALCTLRIPTCCHPDGRIDVLPLANFKVALEPDEVRDNNAAGGIFYGIDIASGCLTFGTKRGTPEIFVRHPRTGEVAQAFFLPYWDEAVALCKAAHIRLGSTFPTVGWDVAVTPQGPILVEMNVRWLRPTGVPGEAFTGETTYVDCVLAHFGRLWPEQMPRGASEGIAGHG